MSRKDKRKAKARQSDQGGYQQPPAQTEMPEQGEAKPQDDPQALRAERDELLGRLQRVSADYVNYQKRVQRDTAHAREFANEELMKSLLAVLDDMERALKAARENHDADDPLLKGMQLVHDKAMETLGKFGLDAIEAEGKNFDPDRHSAIMQEPSADHPPMTVLRELQKGYTLKGRTIRPSAVVVSKAPDDPQDQRQGPPADSESQDEG